MAGTQSSDHFWQAAELADRSGARVFVHPKERANLAGNDDGELFDNFFRQHRMPENFSSRLLINWIGCSNTSYR